MHLDVHSILMQVFTMIATADFLQAGSDLYAFVEFTQHSDAQLALMAMNKRIVLGRVSGKTFLFYY